MLKNKKVYKWFQFRYDFVSVLKNKEIYKLFQFRNDFVWVLENKKVISEFLYEYLKQGSVKVIIIQKIFCMNT